jgi:isopenicillin-N epimerase
MINLKNYFQLSSDVIYLNHGSFGATPIPVMETYQEWQRILEMQPVKFFNHTYREAELIARTVLADYLHAGSDKLVFIPNATYGINLVARSLHFDPGDEILSTNHEYGAVDYTWDFITKRTGTIYKKAAIPLPAPSDGVTLETFWQYVTPRTRLIAISHISSPTALRFPVESICARARRAGILTLIDGAHAPGQIGLNLEEINADFYVGNCHKWLLSPKGAGFLYTNPRVQHLIEPLIVSWGYRYSAENTYGSPYLDNLVWTGTHDPAAALSVPAAIQFLLIHNWDTVRKSCQALLWEALTRISQLTNQELLYPGTGNSFSQMAIAQLPKLTNPAQFKKALLDRKKIEIPVVEWNNGTYIRISIQGYNTAHEIDCLIYALKELIPEFTEK